MPERTRHAPGTPSWIDLGSPDLDASTEFYGRLFGWEATRSGPPEDTGGYRMFELRGRPVAGLGPLMGEGQPPAWTTYVTVADADRTAADAVKHGGSTLLAPLDVLDAGRMAILADADGATFAVWQPGSHAGAGLVTEPGALAWNELHTRDPEASAAFYGELFGWEADTVDVEGGEYTTWLLDSAPVGGMRTLGGEIPAGVPPYWLTYFAVENCDAAVGRAEEAGGVVTVGARTIPAGRFALLADPHGAHFGVIDLDGGSAG